jgi:hypothetical protein
MAFLLNPLHWTIRLIVIVVAGLFLLVVGVEVIKRVHEMSQLAGTASAVGDFAARKMPTGAPAAAKESALVTGRKGSLFHRARPAIKRVALPAAVNGTPVAPELVQQRTAAQQTEITKETGLAAPQAGEVVVYGPFPVPCVFDPQDHDTFDCPRSKHAAFKGNVEVYRNLTTGVFRAEQAPSPSSFLEGRGLREGWRLSAGITYGATAGGSGAVLSGAQLGIGGKARLSKDLFRVGGAWIVVEGEGGWRGGAYGQGGVGAEWRSEP